MSECLVSKFEQHRMFYLQSQWRLLALVTDLQFQDLAIVGVFGCESSPISRNVRSCVRACVRQLVRQMQSKAYTSRRERGRFCNIFLEQSLVCIYCLKLEGCLHNFFLIGPHSDAAEPNSAPKIV